MNATRLTPSPREPSRIAKWLLIVFAAGVLAFLSVPAFATLRQGEPDVFLLTFVMLPWVVGPAALAALLVARARSRREAWLFVGAEVAVVASTAWLWILVTFIRAGHANSQAAVGLLLLPVIQFAALLVYAVGVIAAADFVMADRAQDKPRIARLTILAVLAAALLIVSAWAFGYIRA